MARDRFSNLLTFVCIGAMVLGPVANPLLSQPFSTTGQMSGRVFDQDTRTPISGVKVTAQRVTTHEFFASEETSSLGNYLIADVPAGVYAFSLDDQGTVYTVEGSFDIRAGMSFLFESCFVLDRDSQTALLRSDCSSGLYAEAQVVSLGPHTFFQPNPASSAEPETAQGDLAIIHDGLDCIVREYYPLVSADFEPPEHLQVSRVYFRAAQSPDFYYVEFQDTGKGLQAILPKPAPDTNQVVYYVEGTDLEFNPFRGLEYIPDVTDQETCNRRDPAAAYFMGENPGITIGATVQGAPAVPPGFLSTGITSFVTASGTVTAAATGASVGAATGGIGTTGLVIIIAGAAGAASIIAVSATGEKEASEIR